jgi:hypothetical protein
MLPPGVVNMTAYELVSLAGMGFLSLLLEGEWFA